MVVLGQVKRERTKYMSACGGCRSPLYGYGFRHYSRYQGDIGYTFVVRDG